MKESILPILLIIFNAIIYIFMIICKIFGSIIKIIEEIANLFDTFTKRFANKAENLNSTLDQKEEEKEKDKKAKKAHNAIQLIFHADNVFGHGIYAKFIKVILIGFLQLVSFITTLRGFNQCFSSLWKFAPVILALVIQLALAYFSITISSNYAPKTQIALLFFVSAISIVLSYVGVTETLMPYQEYAKNNYNNFVSVYEAQRFESNTNSIDGENPIAQIKGVYSNINTLIMTVELNYGEDELAKAEKLLDEYKSKEKAVKIESPTYIDSLYDGTQVLIGGGSTIEYVPDDNAVELISEQNQKIQKIKDVQKTVVLLNNLLENECDLDTLLTIVSDQMENSDNDDDEFVNISSSVEMLIDTANALSEKIDVKSDLSLDLRTLVTSYRKRNVVVSLPDLPDFNDILSEWSQNSQSITINEISVKETETEPDPIFTELSTIISKNPNELKNLLDNNVENAYHSMAEALKISNNNTTNLEKAYAEYQLMVPINYAMTSLSPNSNNFKTAVLCLIIAIINDGLAVAFGFFIEPKKVNWFKVSKITPYNVEPYIYTQFKAVMMPAINCIESDNDSLEDIYQKFVEVLTEYIDKFNLAANLCDKGYSRYYIGVIDDPHFRSFCSFLLNCGLAKAITHQEIVKNGFISSLDEIEDNAQGILLTSKGEFWLIEMLGNSSEFIIDFEKLLSN